MSLRGTSGTSLAEVMVMMVILGISIVGIYSMVNSWSQLAALTNTRLNAINIAREWLESVTTLRDTFGLKWYEPGSCTDNSITTPAFFSIDGVLFGNTNCPKTSTTGTSYILTDNRTLLAEASNFPVCINEFGWYSQQFSRKTPTTVVCPDTTPFCREHTTQECKTRFQRKITFGACDGGIPQDYCIQVTSHVWWGTDENDPDTSLTLSQIITRLD